MNNSSNPEKLKQLVQEKYAEIATQSYQQNATSCCGSGCGCATIDEAVMAEDYSKLEGYNPDADLGLGCGIPTAFAQIKENDVVVDLGSGAGNDAFVARSLTGAAGKVIGVDFTDRMIALAKTNAAKLNYENVEFHKGDITKLPLPSSIADVVVSNCVFNLVPEKPMAFAETFRVLKPGGHFSISDIVIHGELPEGLRQSAEMYAGCISGAVSREEYLDMIKAAGFINVTVQKERKITVPDEILSVYLNPEEMKQYHSGAIGIFSITVYAEKPEKTPEPCCGPGCCN